MADASKKQPEPGAAALADVPDRACTWCKVPMMKRLVGGGKFIHYTCPKCIFQHTTKREKKE
ncbi:MAG TPA: hypothetical protein VGQ60_03165 [Nitrospiraceae bacterium]|jgi:hypothetical protein|nr:hypothetical protein [Nitrospiraceae bacterium]